MSRIDLGPRRQPYGDHEPEADGWYGPFHDPDFALKVFRKLRREQKYRGKPSMNIGIGTNSAWLDVPATLVEQAIRRSPSSKWSNCKATTVWWFKPSNFRVNVWGMTHHDESLNRENNWGEDQ